MHGETLFRLGGKNSRQLICIAGCDLGMSYVHVGYIWHMGIILHELFPSCNTCVDESQ